jgi:hypothetical protein
MANAFTDAGRRDLFLAVAGSPRTPEVQMRGP